MNQKSLTLILIILLALIVGEYLIYSGKINLPQKQRPCTKESRICPDGSTVGRTGPKCEFTPCISSAASPTPNSTDETANWKTYTDKTFGYSFKYPNNWEIYAYGHKPEDEPIDGAYERFLRPKGTETPSIYVQVFDSKGTDYNYLEKTFRENSQVKTVKVDGVDILSKVRSALFKNGAYVYHFAALDENSMSIFDQLLSTFKFQ